jgi:hypothetical protein
MHLRKQAADCFSFTRLYAKICEEDGSFTVSVRLTDHRDQSQGAWGQEIASSIEIASSMIESLAKQFSIPQKCISIDIGMANFRDGTRH